MQSISGYIAFCDTAIIPQAASSRSIFRSCGSRHRHRGRSQLKILMKSAWGSDDPTKAAFPFLHGDALSEAGHEVQIFLLGEAVSLMRKSVANAVVPVGWAPLAEFSERLAPRRYQSTRVVLALVPEA